MKRFISLILIIACVLSFSACDLTDILVFLLSTEDTGPESIDTAPSIYTWQYLPFVEDSKIVKYDSKTLKLTENLPIIDGATAAFPVYSAFVNAVYPETTELYDGVFEFRKFINGSYVSNICVINTVDIEKYIYGLFKGMEE